MLQEITTIYNFVLAHNDFMLVILGGSAGLAVTAQGILHKLNVKWQINSKPFSYTLVQVLTLIAALSAYNITGTSFGAAYPWLAVGVAAVHRYLVSPYYTKKVLPYLELQSAAAPQSVTKYQEPQVVPAVEQAPAFVS